MIPWRFRRGEEHAGARSVALAHFESARLSPKISPGSRDESTNGLTIATKWPLIAALSHRSLLPAVVLRYGAMCRLVQEKFNIFGCVGLYARLLQKAEIAEPVDKSKLPRAERYALTIREPAAHVAAVAQQVAGVSAVGINVHLDIW